MAVLTLISDLHFLCARRCITAVHFSSHYLIGKNTASKSVVGGELLKTGNCLTQPGVGPSEGKIFLE